MPAPLSQVVTEKAKHLLASGMNQTDTATTLGISRRTVNQLHAKYSNIINKQATQIAIKSLPLVKDIQIKTLQLAHKALNQDPATFQHLKTMGMTVKELLILSDKKEYRTMQITGVIPTHAPSLFIQLISQTNITQVNPELAAMQAHVSRDLFNDNEVQEAEIEEIDA